MMEFVPIPVKRECALFPAKAVPERFSACIGIWPLLASLPTAQALEEGTTKEAEDHEADKKRNDADRQRRGKVDGGTLADCDVIDHDSGNHGAETEEQ
jgi:hypothetical protein